MGTTSTEAGEADLKAVVKRRIESGPSSQPSLDLAKHLAQLRTLDEHRAKNNSWIAEFIRDQYTRFEDTESLDYKRLLENAFYMEKQPIIQPLGF